MRICMKRMNVVWVNEVANIHKGKSSSKEKRKNTGIGNSSTVFAG